MDTSSRIPGGSSAYHLVFIPLHQGCSFAFPCNEQGVVNLDGLAEQALHNYLLVRGLVGRDFQVPSIVHRAR